MHTSKVLCSRDFRYSPVPAQAGIWADFSTFCPHYHPLDRIGVVSPYLEEGVRQTGYALLALTTAFYDMLRARSADFYDYPHHFAFLDASAQGCKPAAVGWLWITPRWEHPGVASMCGPTPIGLRRLAP
jgi:hypothetical protein